MKNTVLIAIIAILLMVGAGFGVYYGFKWLNPAKTPVNNNVVDNSSTTVDPTTLDDTSTFITTDQTLGDSGNTQEYSITNVDGADTGGFYRVTFSVTPKVATNTAIPYVTAKYLGGSGVIRVTVNGVTSDTSGIDFQKSLDINTNGVVKVYHNVSTVKNQSWYDTGVSASTPFLLSSDVDPATAGSWLVYLDIRYPGSPDSSIDLGSKDYSLNAQSITGAVSTDGAKVSSYSFVTSNSVLEVVWNVAGTTDKPIPSVSAEYTDFTKLVVTFPDLAADSIASVASSLTLPGSVTMSWVRNGSISTYTFDGASKEYSLHGGLNPNQVILDIKLK